MQTLQFPPLSDQEVHIWTACLQGPVADEEIYAKTLSPDEHERISSFKFPQDQRRFTLSRGILRCLLSGYLGYSPDDIELVYGLWGKPCLKDEGILHFNLSHSRDYAVYAFARYDSVGIDLEHRDHSLVTDDAAAQIFTKDELARWHRLEATEKVAKFYQQWVFHEAFLKASGKGWLGELEEKIGPNIYAFEAIPQYTSAVYANGGVLNPQHFSWDHFMKLSSSA